MRQESGRVAQSGAAVDVLQFILIKVAVIGGFAILRLFYGAAPFRLGVFILGAGAAWAGLALSALFPRDVGSAIGAPAGVLVVLLTGAAWLQKRALGRRWDAAPAFRGAAIVLALSGLVFMIANYRVFEYSRPTTLQPFVLGLLLLTAAVVAHALGQRIAHGVYFPRLQRLFSARRSQDAEKNAQGRPAVRRARR